jgi:hypothetical protein
VRQSSPSTTRTTKATTTTCTSGRTWSSIASRAEIAVTMRSGPLFMPNLKPPLPHPKCRKLCYRKKRSSGESSHPWLSNRPSRQRALTTTALCSSGASTLRMLTELITVRLSQSTCNSGASTLREKMATKAPMTQVWFTSGGSTLLATLNKLQVKSPSSFGSGETTLRESSTRCTQITPDPTKVVQACLVRLRLHKGFAHRTRCNLPRSRQMTL